MIAIDIPDFGKLNLKFLVMDYNGTLAVDGELQPGVADRLRILSTKLSLYVVTADTFGTAKEQLHQLPVEIVLLKSADDQARVKEKFVEDLGPKQIAAIGNGRNDRQMLAKARVGIAVVLREGVSSATLGASDIIATGIEDALDLFIHPMRLRATLRG
jgi:P-type E1-E2 ATPase